ncbi:MAG: hypothetical protein ACOX3V_00640 [Bacillota bacterium]|jgi:hypothetical protein
MADGQVTRDTLELIAALRPFAGQRGRRIIDTLMEVAQSASNTMGALEIKDLAEKTKSLLAERIDSAVSLSLLLAAATLGTSLETVLSEPKKSQVNREG